MLLLLLQLLLHLTRALSPGDTFPSCLQADTTWSQDGISDVSFHHPSPESCQELCTSSPTCQGFTWLAPSAPLLPLSCSLFDRADTSQACEHCVSGPGEACSCSMQGECAIQDGNLIESRDGVETRADCEGICTETAGCNFYTYLEESSPFRHTCFLFTSCDDFYACGECTTGLVECSICTFEDTLPNGLCNDSSTTTSSPTTTTPVACEDGWSRFEDACYIVLDNWDNRYDDINVCRDLCGSMGGSLGSIHSEEENQFVYSLLRYGYYRGQATWLGAYIGPGPHYFWEDGTAWDYTNWVTGEPDVDPDFACVSIGNAPNMASPKKWVDGPCKTQTSDYDCLCKISDTPTITTTTEVTPNIPSTSPTSLAPTTTTTAQASCGDGWSLYNNACYTIMNSNDRHYGQYTECRHDCLSAGGLPGSIHSQAENEFVYQLLRPVRSGYGEQATWLGGDMGGEMGGNWEDGSSWDYNNWGPGQPDDGFGSCLIMGWNKNSEWDDGACEWNCDGTCIFDCLCKRSL